MRKLNDSVLLSLALVRSIGAAINHIDDCDEVFNYWEPLHYLVYGSGMQTWEYAPEYALRTYGYLAPFAMIGKFISFCGVDKLGVFFTIRMSMALLSAGFETVFVQSIQQKFGKNIGDFTYWFLLLSPGCFMSSTALLPSSFCYYCVLAGYNAWLLEKPLLTVLAGSIAVFWSGWPFIGVMFLPIGLAVLSNILSTKGGTAAIKFCLQSIVVVLCAALPPIAIDIIMYKKFTLPSLNILMYNALAGSGDELYGVAPASYYMKNLVLNFNVGWLLALALPLLIAYQHIRFARPAGETTVACFPAALWLGIMFARPHKEERFLYPVYPILALAAGFALNLLCETFSGVVENKIHTLTGGGVSRVRVLGAARKWLIRVFVASALLLGVSRTSSHYMNYSGYMAVWKEFAKSDFASLTPDQHVNVCMGNDWYTFPSSFFLPNNQVHLQFVKSEFTGQLPQPFSEHNGTFAAPRQPFNSLNKEESSRYIPLTSCDYVVSTVHDPPRTQVAKTVASNPAWKVLTAKRVIDPDRSPTLTRAFHIPRWSDAQNIFAKYTMFAREQS